MSDQNLFPDLDSFNNPSLLSIPHFTQSLQLIESNRIIPGLLSMTAFEKKLQPPPLEDSEEQSLAVKIENP